jgi:hypothetical protein
MNYVSGQTVKLGDKVSLGQDSDGVVVCVIDRGEYSEGYPESQWSYLKKGVMINFPLHGLIHYEEIEPDIRLIKRAGS